MLTHLSRFVAVLGGLLAILGPAYADDADYKVYSEPPRLFLTARRLKLLQRETQRESLRWMPFEALIQGKARMPEPGFALALYGRVKGDAAACAAAVQWSLAEASASRPAELRQMALAYDWCNGLAPEAQTAQLAARLRPALDSTSNALPALRSRVLAAVALADLDPAKSQAVLKQAVEQWWRGGVLPGLEANHYPFTRRDEVFALVEILHVIHDNLNIDLREEAGKFFEKLPPFLILTDYPAPWPAPENEYRIPLYTENGDPDLREAALARAAELALVAYDTNSPMNQYLQGWLIIDRFLMRGAFGLPYEFLWANPYHPGLSYYYLPNLFHDDGRLFVRSTWEEDAIWFGYADGKAQFFQNGSRHSVNWKQSVAPLDVGAVHIVFWGTEPKFVAKETTLVVGLEPGKAYDIELDDEEMFEARADSGGILEIHLPKERSSGARLHRAAAVN
jgi:hypothetical protein